MGGNEPKEFQGLGLLAHYSMKVQFCTAYFKKKSENFVFFFRFMLFSRFVLFTVKRKRPSLRSCSRKFITTNYTHPVQAADDIRLGRAQPAHDAFADII